MNPAELVEGPGAEWRRELAAEQADDLRAIIRADFLTPVCHCEHSHAMHSAELGCVLCDCTYLRVTTDAPRPARRRRVYRPRAMQLTICAAGRGVLGRSGVPVVCGREPGHQGPHSDIEYTLTWNGDGDDA